MWGYWFFVVAVVAAAAWSVAVGLRSPAVWRGGRQALGAVVGLMVPSSISRRTYLPFALMVNLFFGGLLLVVGGGRLGVGWVTTTGLWGVLLSFPAFALWLSVKLFNRPRLLVPSSERGKAGSFGQARARRKRRAAGKPPTVHEVEVLDVRPPPGRPDDFTPYFVAMCTDDECDWQSDPVGYEQDPDPEANVRRQAAEHSDRIAKATRRPVG
jgi:hypothetical protein